MTVSTARRLARLFFACALSTHAFVLAQSKAIIPRGPFTGSPLPVPGHIEAEHYDLGGEGVAYHDTTPGNLGGSYRTDFVDLTGCGDAGCGYKVSWIEANEWLEYTVTIAETGVYRLTTRTATPNRLTQHPIVLKFLRVVPETPPIIVEPIEPVLQILASIELPYTGVGDGETWTTVATDGINLNGGPLRLRLATNTGGFDINWFEFVRNSMPWSGLLGRTS